MNVDINESETKNQNVVRGQNSSIRNVLSSLTRAVNWPNSEMARASRETGVEGCGWVTVALACLSDRRTPWMIPSMMSDSGVVNFHVKSQIAPY